jgi:hypothetical protein
MSKGKAITPREADEIWQAVIDLAAKYKIEPVTVGKLANARSKGYTRGSA